MPKPVFILASSSPRRLALLKDIGVTPDKIIAADIDETPKRKELPRPYAKRLAMQKLHVAAAQIIPSPAPREREGPVAKRREGEGEGASTNPHPPRGANAPLGTFSRNAGEGVIILAADTAVACGRRILPKAESDSEVRDCLKLLSGRRHHVYTAVAIRAANGKIIERIADSVVTFRQMSEKEIDAYAKSSEGIGKAGGYAIQGRAAAYIRFISGSYSNIVGLPLFDVAQILRGCGYEV